MRAHSIARLAFPEAAAAWLATRQLYLAPKTYKEYSLNIRTLCRFFSQKTLLEITADDLREFQRFRLKECGPVSINHECSVLQQMLKRVGRWPEIALDYQALPLSKEKRGRVLTDDEKLRLFEIASTRDSWLAAYTASMISINTTAGPKEVGTLRLQDIDTVHRTMRVQPEGSKNIYRTRIIPLNDDGLYAIKIALNRAYDLGSRLPHHYLFPFRMNKGNEHDPCRHQTTFKTAWRNIMKAARIENFRMYDLRHHAMTSLLENPECSEQTAEDIAGQISREMKKRYSHIRIEAKRKAVEALLVERIGVALPPKKPAKSEVSTASTDVGERLLELLTKLLKTG